MTVYLVALGVERLTVRDVTATAYFWPACGVAALWMLSGRTRGQVVLDAALHVLSTAVLDVLLGLDLLPAVLFGLANLAVGGIIRHASSVTERLSCWGPLPRRLAGTRDLWNLGLAAVVAAVASAVPGLLGVLAESGSPSSAEVTLWVVRSACSTFLVVASVLSLLTAVLRAHARHGPGAMFTASPRGHWRLELAMLIAVSSVSAVVIFGSHGALPVAFLMIMVSTWAGSRFSPAVGGSYAILLSSLAALCTQVGRGPFGSIEDPTARAVVIQVYALMTTVIVLMLSLGTAERAALLARALESEARASERADLVDAVTTVMTDGLVVVDANLDVLLSNPAAGRMAGVVATSSQDSTAQSFGVFRLDGSTPPLEELPRARALRGEFVPPTDVLCIDPKTGEQRILSISSAPLPPTGPGRPAMAVIVMRDVTKLHAQRRELESFAGVVAHDLKAPLTGVVSWAEILEEQLEDAAVADGVEMLASISRIRGSADRMTNLISDLLAYTQARDAELSVESVPLDELVDQIARELQDTHHDEIPVVEHAPLGRVMADPTLVRQLLTNVIGNAVKYVAPGVTPRVVIGSAPVDEMLEIWVSDNGIGIPDRDLGHVFDSFFRASSTRDYPGTGLGLAICARTVERHGGRISARKGQGGQGTSMIFTLPLDTTPPPSDSPQPGLERVSATS
jgi:signal transduction histidine kinase